ncbi:clasp N terminal-domain-containing protein [Phlyctochytrium arcticum]|nr:clasp N terminal-domain-containing protein [Phlyctochytrium arcticum]
MEDITRFVEASNSSNVERKLETLEQVSNAIDSINFASIEAADYEDLLEATVKGIRTPQLKLCQQTLSFISILLAKVASSPAKSAIPLLKTLTVFTVSAIIDKFADGKEKVREQAQFVILDLYRTIHRGVTTSSAKETNAFQQMLNFMDREIKNNGLGHKTTRGREQSMLCIAHCVMEIPAYAVRQFIPTIIKLLEDSNEGVRNGSKDALIKIHNHTASKLVRQDIRRELIKNKIRQSIVDQLVAEFIHRPDENVLEESTNSLSECSDPPSSHGTTADSSTRPSTGTVSAPQASDSEETLVVKVDSSRELEHEISRFIALFEGKETEENWKSRDNALLRLRGICRGNARQYEGFIHLLRGCSDAVTKTMHSLRTTLVLTTCKTVEVMAEILGVALDPLADAFMTNLMKLTGMAKKLIATASIEAIQMILNHCPFHLKYLQLFHTTMSDKSINSRAASASFIKQTLELMASVESKRHSLDRAGGLDVLEKALKKGLQDAHGPVRQICREAFAVFQRLWPERGAHLFTQLDVATRKAISREKVSEEKKSKVTLAAARAAFLKKAAAAKVAQASLEAERSIEIEIFAPPTPPPAALNDQFVVPMKEVESKETQSTVAAQVVMDHDTVRETTPQQEVDSSPIGLFLLSLREGDVEEKIHNLELFCQSLREQPEMAAMFSGQILRSLSDAIYDVLLQYSSDNVVSVTRNMETLVECRIIDEQQVAQVVRYLIIRFEQTQPESVAHLRNFANTTVTPGTLVALLMEHLSKENSSHAVNMLVDWIAQLFNDERDRLMEYFENPDAKRFCFHVLVSRFGPSSPNLRALQLLSFINELDQRFFEQLLETCDHETKDLVAEALQGPLEGERTPPATSLQTDRIQVEDISRIDAGEGGTMLDMTDMTFDTSLMLQNGIPDLMEETMPYGMADMSCIQASVMTAHAPTASLSAPMDPQLAHHFNSPIKSTAFEAHDVGNRSARGMLARSAGDSDDGHDLDQTVNDTPSPQSVKTSAGMVGIKRQSAEELLTPVKKIFKSRSERGRNAPDTVQAYTPKS